jgi:hypothetical protein
MLCFDGAHLSKKSPPGEGGVLLYPCRARPPLCVPPTGRLVMPRRAATTPPDAIEAIKEAKKQRCKEACRRVWLCLAGVPWFWCLSNVKLSTNVLWQAGTSYGESDCKEVVWPTSSRSTRKGLQGQQEPQGFGTGEWGPLASLPGVLERSSSSKNLVNPGWPFQDLQQPPSELRKLQADHGGGADSGMHRGLKRDSSCSLLGYRRVNGIVRANHQM